MKKPFLGVLALVLCSAIAFAGDVTVWVPPYYIKDCKKTVVEDFGGIQMKDAITALGLQFWVPDTDKVVYHPKYAKNGDTSKVNDETVRWFADWGRRNNITVMLCIFNAMEGDTWDWNLVRQSLKPENRTKFIASVVAEMDRLGLTGVDVDFEGNGSETTADSLDFYEFSQELADSVHKRDGALVKIATFNDKYNSPSLAWRPKLLKIYDNVEGMSYTSTTAPLAGTGASRTYDSLMRNAFHVADTPYVHRLMIGFTGDSNSWKNVALQDNLDWFLANKTITDSTSFGICIWDGKLKASQWHEARTWQKVAQISADVRARRNVPFDSSCTRTLLPGRFNLRYQNSYLSGHQKNNYASQGGAWQVGDKVVIKGHSCSEAMEVVEPQANDSTYVRLAGKWNGSDRIRFEFEKVTWPAPEDSTAISAKDFALPGFRASATVYGVTGKSLLKLPEGEWASAEQVRDAVRGRLPAGVYLVKFDGAAQALKISIDR